MWNFFLIWVKVKSGHPLCLPWPQMKRRRRRTRHSPPLPFLKQLIPGHMSSERRFRDFHPRVAFTLTSVISLTSAEVSVTSSARLLGVVSSFSIEKQVHWIPTICIFSSDPCVPCFAPKISKASIPVLPPRQSGRHWNTQGTIWAADEVYRPLSSVPARPTLFNGLRSSCTDAAIIIFPIKKQ